MSMNGTKPVVLSDEIVLAVARIVAIHKGMLDTEPIPKTVSLVIKLRGPNVATIILRPEYR